MIRGKEDKTRENRTMAFYPKEDARGIDLPISAVGLSEAHIHWAEFKKAYFISAPWWDKFGEDGRCQPAWWFTPPDKVEQVCAPAEGMAKQSMFFAPSAKGLLRILAHRKTARARAPGGVYLTNAKGETAKIWEGPVDGGLASPDGCHLALTYGVTLTMIELCR